MNRPPKRPGPEEEPFRLLTRSSGHASGEYQATASDISRQVAALSAQCGAHFQQTSARQTQFAVQLNDLQSNVERRFDNFHEELALLRHTTLGEGGIQERVTSVEQRTLRSKALSVTGAGAKWLTMAVGAAGIALQVATSFYPRAVGPLHTLVDFLKQVAG